MDGATATLWGALITAFAGAGVFLAGEIIKLVSSHADRRAAKIDEVLQALGEIVTAATRPKITSIWSSKPIRYMVAAMGLFPILRKRDAVVVDWLMDSSKRMSAVATGEEMGNLVGEAQGMLMLWMRYPRMGRLQMVKDLRTRNVESPVADLMREKPGY